MAYPEIADRREGASLLLQQAPPMITVDDTDFTYSGAWEHYSGQIGNHNTTMSAITNAPGAYATYTFTGSGITLYSKTGNNRGKMAVYLDDVLLTNADLYTPNFVFQNPVYSASFPFGQHTVKVEWTGTKNPNSTGTAIVIDKIAYTGPEIPADAVTIDDPDLSYSGTWSHFSNQAGNYNTTMSTTNNVPGAYATYTFTGSAFIVYSKTWNNRGKMSVYLDDTLVTIIDLYTSNEVFQNPVFATSFPYGQHTVKFEWMGTKNSISTGTAIVLDKLTYIPGTPPTPTPTATFTPTATYTPTKTFTPVATATVTPTPTNSYTYNRPVAVAYADQWSHDRNSNFPNYGSQCDGCEDCTNYVSQTLYSGGYPLRTGSWNENSVFEWWYRDGILFQPDNSKTWSAADWMNSYFAQYPDEFDVNPSTGLEGGDIIILDLDDDLIPDHVRVVVGNGFTSINEIDYISWDTDGNSCWEVVNTVPAPVNTLLINQHCPDRWHVAWDYNIPPATNRWYIHVIQ